MMKQDCETCKLMTEEYFKQNPEKNGYVICESCYEKSKDFIHYFNENYHKLFLIKDWTV